VAMRYLPMMTFACLMVTSHLAFADCEDFGRHSPPVNPVLSPQVEDLPFASFKWGTDAKRDQFQQWWRTNIVANSANGTPLVVDWPKAGITRGLATPVPVGRSHCVEDLLPLEAQLVPTLDPDAPITYSSNRHHSAAVYVANAQAKAPNAAGSRVQTTYQDRQGKDHEILVSVFTGGSKEAAGRPNAISVAVQKNPELTVGISDLVESVNADQLGSIQRSFQAQGFNVDVTTLSEFAGSDAVKQLFWSGSTAPPVGKVLFLSKGTKAVFEYPISTRATVTERGAMLIILDPDKRPVAADKINLIVPQGQ
jgi:hypothetical protein